MSDVLPFSLDRRADADQQSYCISSLIQLPMLLFRPNPSSGVPIYLQLMEQVKHAIDTGVLRPGEQLPGIRPLAEELVINPNTVAKAYRELEHEGVIELRQRARGFVFAHAPPEKHTHPGRPGQANGGATGPRRPSRVSH